MRGNWILPRVRRKIYYRRRAKWLSVFKARIVNEDPLMVYPIPNGVFVQHETECSKLVVELIDVRGSVVRMTLLVDLKEDKKREPTRHHVSRACTVQLNLSFVFIFNFWCVVCCFLNIRHIASLCHIPKKHRMSVILEKRNRFCLHLAIYRDWYPANYS